jgi:CheY-like chemotaxis protein
MNERGEWGSKGQTAVGSVVPGGGDDLDVVARHRGVVLVVDDDEIVREALADRLTEEGYEVLTAADGAKAMDCLRKPSAPRPSLIVLDLMMPVMNGQQFYRAKQLDSTLAAIPVLVMSADRDLPEKALILGTEYLAKATGVEAVLESVARLCGVGPASTAPLPS